MLKLLRIFLIGHDHKWKTTDERPLVNGYSGSTGMRYIQRCEICGKVVKRDLIG